MDPDARRLVAWVEWPLTEIARIPTANPLPWPIRNVLMEVIVSCGGKPNLQSSVVLAWTSGSSASDLFAAATRPLQTIDWNLAVVTLDMEASSDTASIGSG